MACGIACEGRKTKFMRSAKDVTWNTCDVARAARQVDACSEPGGIIVKSPISSGRVRAVIGRRPTPRKMLAAVATLGLTASFFDSRSFVNAFGRTLRTNRAL